MHHLICKTLLVLAILFAIIAIVTPDWQVGTATLDNNDSVSASQGLFKLCVAGQIEIFGKKSTTSGCHSFPAESTDADKVRRSCAGLAISSVVFLILSLVSDFIPQKEFKHCKLVSQGSLMVGIILMITCVSLYGSKVYSGWVQSSGALNSKHNYGYSFYLAIASLLLAMGTGIADIMKKV